MNVKVIRGVYDFYASGWIRRPPLAELWSDPEIWVTVRDLLSISQIKEIPLKDYLIGWDLSCASSRKHYQKELFGEFSHE